MLCFTKVYQNIDAAMHNFLYTYPQTFASQKLFPIPLKNYHIYTILKFLQYQDLTFFRDRF